MSGHVIIEFIIQVGERDKMRGLLSILLIFRNVFNKFNKTGAKNVRFYLSYDTKTTVKPVFNLAATH